ncbi:hypothetical protein Ciccas_008259 [Cichlidogyrus casuarinus]|uniref:Cilia- and flagella-associated protein 299 n=1 Tax=Cichlidogyrus casuarinus TaxID=1844966 RepID=A0ABD2Q0K9_9PLAT
MFFRALVHNGLELTDPFDIALANREEANRNGQLSTIIFIRDFNERGQEISGYIDYDQRLRNEEFVQYFRGEKKLLPKPSDLSYYNWESNYVVSNSSPNYTVIAESMAGLIFKNKRDRKIIYVDRSQSNCGDNTTRTVIKTSKYVQIILYDHAIRRRN